MKILPIVLGVLLLVAGRRLYWLFVGAVGFLIGMRIAERFFPQEGSWQYLLIVVLAGLAGALLAMVIQRIAVLLAGALAGGYVLSSLLRGHGVHTLYMPWILFAIGAIIGAFLVALIFDWALIVPSSLLGAQLVVEGLAPREISVPLLLGLFAVGVVIQGFGMRGRVAEPD